MRQQDMLADTPIYEELIPPPELADYIDACWFYHARLTAPRPDILVPEGVVDLIFNFGAPYYRESTAGAKGQGDWIAGDVVVGQRTQLFRVEWPEDTRLFSIRLRAEEAYRLFTRPMHELTNRVKPLTEAGFLNLSRKIHSIPYDNKAQITHRCLKVLADLVPTFGSADPRVSSLLHLIKCEQGNLDIHGLSEASGISRRTIERLFADKVGTSPKFYARAIRLHHFLCLQQERREENLSHAAVDANYYDQSHLNRDFKQFTGESPAKFFNSPPDIYEPLLASLLSRQATKRQENGPM